MKVVNILLSLLLLAGMAGCASVAQKDHHSYDVRMIKKYGYEEALNTQVRCLMYILWTTHDIDKNVPVFDRLDKTYTETLAKKFQLLRDGINSQYYSLKHKTFPVDISLTPKAAAKEISNKYAPGAHSDEIISVLEEIRAWTNILGLDYEITDKGILIKE